MNASQRLYAPVALAATLLAYLCFPNTALPDAGIPWAWGQGGKLGNNSWDQQLQPIQVHYIADAVGLGYFWEHGLAVLSNGTVMAWGQGGQAQLGAGPATTFGYEPLEVPALSGIVQVAAGKEHSLALTADGHVYAWGYNSYGEVGDGSTTTRWEPVLVADLSNVVAIAAGQHHSLAAKSDGTAWAWGRGDGRQLGNGGWTNTNRPCQVHIVTNIVALAGGEQHTVALTGDGSVWAWGANFVGQVGDGTFTWRDEPVPVSGLSGVTSIAAGWRHSLAVKSDGSTWSWGSNFYGQLGINSTADTNLPVQVHLISNIVAVAGGDYHSLAIRDDGTVWAWGYNISGQLGNGTTSQRLEPVQVSVITDAPTNNPAALAAGWRNSFVIRQSGIQAPGPPTNVQATDGTNPGRVSITWVEPGDADHYEIWRNVSNDLPTAEQVIAGTGGTYASDDSVIPLTTNHYWVRSVNIGGKTFSAPDTGWRWVGTPGNLQASDGTYIDRIEITWDPVPNVPEYEVYRGTNQWDYNVASLIAPALTTNRFEDTTSGGGMHYYWVLGVNGTHRSPFGGSDEGSLAIWAPPSIDATDGAFPDKVVISWDPVGVATSYQVWVSGTDDSGTASLLAGDLTGTNYEDTVFGPDLRYYWIKSVSATHTSLFSASDSGYMTIPAPGNVSASDGTHTDRVVVSWDAVASATSYDVWRSSTDDPGTASLVAPAEPGLSYDDLAAPDGALFYWVKAKNATFTSAFSASDAGYLEIVAPTGVAASDAGYSGFVRVSWNAVNGAEVYEVWRNDTNASGTAVLVASSVHATIYDDVLALPGVTYWYWVKAKHAAGEGPLSAPDAGVRRTPSNTVRAWGSGWAGQIGDGTNLVRHAPVALTTISNCMDVAAGQYFSLAVKDDATLWAWGYNTYGRLGDGTTTTRYAPVHISTISNVVDVAAGREHGLALTVDGTVWGWGRNYAGQVGDGTQIERHAPVPVAGLSNVVAIAAEFSHSLALCNDGTVWGWGAVWPGSPLQPMQITNLTDAVSIAAGYQFSVVATSDGAAWAWGRNAFGTLGDGTTTDRYGEVDRVHVISNVVQVTGSGTHAGAVVSNGTAWTWGYNANGQLGDGTQTQRLEPVPVVGLSNVVSISAGGSHTLALAADKTAWSWGQNNQGQLGDGTTTEAHAPISIPGLTGVQQLTAGIDHNLVLLAGATPPPDPPASIVASDGLYPDRVTIAWGAAFGATSYQVWRNSTLIAEDVIGATFDDLTAVPDSVYTYAVKTVGEGGVSGLSPSDTGYRKLSPPANVQASDGTHEAKIQVTWDAAPGALLYGLYRNTTNDPGTATPLDYSLAGLSYDDTNIVDGVLYYWIDSQGLTTSSLSSADSGYPGIWRPTAVSASDGAFSNKVVVSWDPVLPATAYEVWRNSTDDAGIASLIAPSVSGTTYDDTSAPPGALYYWVKAKNASFTSDFSVPDSGFLFLAIPTGLMATDGTYTDRIRVSWNPVAQAEHYDLWRAMSSDTTGAVRVSSGLSATQFDDRRVLPGTPYWYWVEAAHSGGTSGLSAGDDGYRELLPTAAWAWGSGGPSGQLGNGTVVNKLVPTAVSNLMNLIAIDGGGSHSVAALSDGSCWAWGESNNGRLGVDIIPLVDQHIPVQMANVSNITDVAGGGDFSVMLQDNGRVWVTGANNYSQLGMTGYPLGVHTPVRLFHLSDITAISAGGTFAFAVGHDGAVWGWGRNDDGQLGDGTTTFERAPPVRMVGVSNAVAVSAGTSFSLILRADGTVWGTGNNEFGHLGDNTTSNRQTVVMTHNLSNVVAIAAGGHHSLALRDDGSVWAWGYNMQGQLGDGTDTERHEPVQVNSLSNITAIAAGDWHSLALRQDGTIWAWGDNFGGQVGDNSTTRRYAPVQVHVLTNAIDIGNGEDFSFALTPPPVPPPDPPLGLQASDGTETDYVALTWNPSAGATHYQIYRYFTDVPGSATQVGFDVAGTTFNDTTAVHGTLYYYWVRGTGEGGTGGFSASDAGYRGVAAPTGVAASDGTHGDKVRVTWVAPPGGVDYFVWRSETDQLGDAVLVNTQFGTTYDDTNTVPETVYHYWIRARAGLSTSGFSTPDSGFRGLPAPTGMLASAGTYTGKIEVTWSPSLGASAYDLYRSLVFDTNTATHLAGPLVTTMYDDTSAEPGLLYYYWVKGTSGTSTSAFSSVAAGWRSPEQPTGVAATDGTWLDRVRVTWSAAPYADRYDIARNVSNDVSTAQVLAWYHSGTLYDDLSASPGVVYYYFVRSKRGSYTGGYGTPDTGYTEFLAPTGVEATDGSHTDKTVVTWIASQGAASYEVYRHTTDDSGAATMIADAVSTTGYEDGTGTQGLLYYYWVKGRNGPASTGFSGSDDGYSGLPAPTGVDASDGTYPDKVTVTWDAVAGATGYTVSRGLTDNPADAGVVTSSVAGTGFDDYTATPGWLYRYWVQAESAAGTGPSGSSDTGFSGGIPPGLLWAWGFNHRGQLGDGTVATRYTPVAVSGLSNVVDVAGGLWHAVAATADGTARAWGYNGQGQVGDNSTADRDTPVTVNLLSNVTAVAAGEAFSLALKEEGTVWAWGENSQGQLGDGTGAQRLQPVQVSVVSNIAAIVAGQDFSLAVDRDGEVWAWGWNQNGQLGDNTTTTRFAPVQVEALTEVLAVAAGDVFALALRADGTVWAWGGNAVGQLGNGTSAERHRPIPIPGLSNIVAITAGGSHGLALDNQGVVRAWGLNGDGQVGDGTTTTRYAPALVSGLSNVVTIAAGGRHSLALRSDLTGWGWGQNNEGEVGDGTAGDRLVPVQVSHLNFATDIAAGALASYAIRGSADSAPPAPPLVVASDGTFEDMVRVGWVASPGALDYLVLRNDSNDVSSAVAVASAVTGAIYDDTTAADGTLYYYWVEAQIIGPASPPSDHDTGYTYLDPPANVMASDGTSATAVTVTWDAAPGSTAYHVWRCTLDDSGYASNIAAGVTLTSYDDTSTQPGELHVYWVQADYAGLLSPLSASDNGYRDGATPMWLDSDGDHIADEEERHCATDPFDAADVLRIVEVAPWPTGESTIFTWSVKADVPYRVMRSEDHLNYDLAPSGVASNEKSQQQSSIDGVLTYTDPSLPAGGQATYSVTVEY